MQKRQGQVAAISSSDATVALDRHGSRVAATCQTTLLRVGGEIVDQIDHKTTPSCLVAGTNTGTIVSVEVLIKQ